MKQEHELAGIEVLRFFCAFGILIWHYQQFFFLGEWNPAVGQALRPTLPLYHVLSVFYENGSLAVPFFWVISGFIFYWHYCEPIRNGTVRFSEFLVRRFSRLYPLHFVTLILVAVGQYVYRASHETSFIYIWDKPIWFASQLLFASNWFKRQPVTFNGPIWSVSIEILVYLSFFFIVRKYRPGVLLSVCIAAAFSACFNFLHSFISTEVFACGMYFFAGGVAQRLALLRSALPVATCTAAAMLITLSLGLVDINAASVLLLATSAVIIFAKLDGTTFAAPLRYVGFLGNATYSSYLLHFPLQLLIVIVVDMVGWKRDLFHSPIVFLGFLSLVIGLSLFVHRYFEMPAQRAIRAGAEFSLGTPSQRRRLVD
jgi:peptidoglycan/LPS O-acetylase OafA/YrhL